MSNIYKNMDNKKARERQKFKNLVAMQMQLDDEEVRHCVMKIDPAQGHADKKAGGVKWRYAKTVGVKCS